MKIKPCMVRGIRHWKIEIGGADGKRKRQFFRDREEAGKALKKALKDQSDVGRGWEILTAREKADIMHILRQIQEAGWTLAQVWDTARTVPKAPVNGCTLRQALDELLEAKRAINCSARHIGNLKWYLEHFIRGREQADVSTIGERELAEWFAGRKEAPRSKNGHIGLLSALFAHCWRKRYILENPAKRLESAHVDRETPATLDIRQCRKAMIFALRRAPKLLGWLTLALFCGMRPDAEADFIDWSMVDLEHGRIIVKKSKIRHVRPRIIDLNFCPPALAWLKVAKARGCPLKLPFVTRRRHVRKLRAYLGLDRWPQDVLRHTAASNLLAFHQDAGKVAEFLGHSAGTLLRDYKALVFKEDAQKFMALLPKERHKKKAPPQHP